ncbi:MAG: Secretory lipase [Aeromicrobium sp.]|jgi:hypothetical protein|nr:Secretory lipase [Aeromicrobium sp.]
MKRALILISLLAISIATLASPASAARVPVPEKDPFYAVPANVGTYAPGAVIASRKVSTSAFGFPMPATAWQIKYRTNDSKGRASATVTTLLVPKAAWRGAGTRPLVSYQTAEDGVAGKCAPSYALTAGPIADFSNSEGETGVMYLALLKGWAVTVPDYEGPRSEFLVAKTEGQAVLDGVRASLAFTEGGLAPTTKTALWGYSGGSFASVHAAQMQPTYAPDLNFSALALGGLVGDIRSTIDKFSGGPAGGAVAMGVNGFVRAYPELNIADYLSPTGIAKVAKASGDCLTDAAIRFPFLSIAQIEKTPGSFYSPAIVAMLHDNSPLGDPGTPTMPIYDYHAKLDEFAPIGPDRELITRFCHDGVTVQHVEDLVGEHISELVTGAPGAIAFFSDRFAGKPAVNTCATVPAP